MNLKRVINNIEKENYSLLTGFAGLLSVITVRNIFESAFEGSQIFGFSPVTQNSFYMIFSHFPLFYISLFLWFLLLLTLITGQRPNTIARPMLIGFSVIIIAPFIDIIVSRGSGYRLIYLKGIEEITEVYRLFDFTRDLTEASWGQRIEILLVLIGATAYVRIKTKNALKTIIAPVIAYLLITLHGVLPNTVAQIPSYLGFDRLDYRTIITGGILGVDSQNYSVIFLVSIVICGIFVLRRWHRGSVSRIFDFRRSIAVMVLAAVGISWGVYLMLPFFPRVLGSSIHYLLFALAIFTIHITRITTDSPPRSDERKALTIFAIFAALAIGIPFFLVVAAYFSLVNYGAPALRRRMSSRILRSYAPAGVSMVLAFLAGFSVVFQDAALSCVVPLDRAKVEVHARKTAARNYYIGRDHANALRQYQMVFSLEKDNDTRKKLGQSLLQTGNIDSGTRILEDVEPLDYETALALGNAYAQTGRDKEANRVYAAAVEANIEPQIFIHFLAQSAARRGSAEEMDSWLELGTRHGMARFRYYQIKGDYHLQAGDYDAAITMYDRALKYGARATWAHAGRGMAYYNQGDFAKAEQAFSTALRFEPDNDVLHNNLGAIYIIKRDFEKAQAFFERSLKINPVQAEAYFNLGLIARFLGQNERAVMMYNKAIEINPGFEPARIALQRLLGNE